MGRRLRRSLLAGVLALAAVTAPGYQAGASDTPREFTAWQWNIQGGYNGTHLQQVKVVTGSILKYDADFVVVNELCYDQYRTLITRLKDYGWPQGTSYARYTRMDNRASCKAGDANKYGSVGFAIFSKHQLAAGIERVALPEDTYDTLPNRTHYLACATLKADTKVKMCGTHITPTREDANGNPVSIRSRQILAVTQKVNSDVDAGDAVMLAGDFNMQPHEAGLNRLYSVNVAGTVNRGNYGKFRELDDNDSSNCLGYGAFTKDNGAGPEECGDGGRKLDFLFVSENRIVGGYSAKVLGISETCGGPCSDHHAIVGDVSLAL